MKSGQMALNKRVKDLTGMKFNRWTVLGGFYSLNRSSFWQCRCDCGTVKDVRAAHLPDGASKSCGCHNIEAIKARNFRHGMAKTRVHKIWKGMRRRCYGQGEPAYPEYGGRGIRVCRRWHTFVNFYADMGDPPPGRYSIDRIDNNGNYSPDNCRWANDFEQANNTRVNRLLTIRGETMTMADAARKYTSVSYYTIRSRIRNGWAHEQAVGLAPHPKARV